MRAFVLSFAYWLSLGVGTVHAQWQLQIAGSETEQKFVHSYLPSSNFSSQAEAYQAAHSVVADLQRTGYFQAYLEWLPPPDSTVCRVSIHRGPLFQWVHLQAGNLDPLLQAHSGYREELFWEHPFSLADFQELVDKCLDYSDNNGYPFASVQLKDVEVKGQAVLATLDYQSGPLIRFGELNVRGTDKIDPEFLETYLGIRTGMIYSEKKSTQIADRLQQLPFLSLSGPIETKFQNEVADIHLPLTYQASSQVDGILSVLPADGQGGRTLLTGELNILLRNLGRSGKLFSLNWQRLQIASQRLSIEYNHPNVLKSPLGVHVDFDLLKEDTLFLNQQATLTFSSLLGGSHLFDVFGDWRSSRLIGKNTLPSFGDLSSLANITVRGGGIGYRFNQVDELLFPRRGYQLSVRGRVGQKTTSLWMNESTQNGKLTQYLQVNTQWAGELFFAQYYMLGTSLGVYNRLLGAGLADSKLFVNELYRLGGLKNLRGFADNFLFASQYALSNLELRWLLEPESAIPSYLFAFYDQAWMLQPRQEQYITDMPLGVGVGGSLSTQAGLFSLVYALGKSQHQTLSFSTSKVHFGYISRF